MSEEVDTRVDAMGDSKDSPTASTVAPNLIECPVCLGAGAGCEACDCNGFVQRCPTCADLLKELQHLVRLMEPLEQSGRLEVPGIATLNGARAAIAAAKGR